MPKQRRNRRPRRADQGLRTAIKQLREDIESLRRRLEDQANDLKIQFVRIAEIQAELDSRHLAEANAAPPTLQK